MLAGPSGQKRLLCIALDKGVTSDKVWCSGQHAQDKHLKAILAFTETGQACINASARCKNMILAAAACYSS